MSKSELKLVLEGFKKTPRLEFLIQLLVPGVLVFVFSVGLLGEYVSKPEIYKPALQAGELAPPRILYFEAVSKSSYFGGIQAGGFFYAHLLDTLLRIPQFCQQGETPSEYQYQQCQKLYSRIQRDALFCAMPIIVAVLLLFLAYQNFEGLYGNARGKLKRGKALSIAKIIDIHHGFDLFAWFYRLDTYWVEAKIESDKGLRVMRLLIYVPKDVSRPQPNETVALFSFGGTRFDFEKSIKITKKLLLSTRFFGVVYQPHIAVK